MQEEALEGGTGPLSMGMASLEMLGLTLPHATKIVAVRIKHKEIEMEMDFILRR